MYYTLTIIVACNLTPKMAMLVVSRPGLMLVLGSIHKLQCIKMKGPFYPKEGSFFKIQPKILASWQQHYTRLVGPSWAKFTLYMEFDQVSRKSV